jgi:hypothetical protein
MLREIEKVGVSVKGMNRGHRQQAILVVLDKSPGRGSQKNAY